MALIDRLKFDAPSDDWVVWKHPSEELRLGAQVVVNESQDALFLKGGQALDVLGPGTHTLATGNIPLLSRLINLPFGGKTPFTAEVWYVNKHARRDLRWGTKTPIPLLDPIYNYPINARAYGRWGMRVQDARLFVGQLVGTLKTYTTDQVYEHFIALVIQNLSDRLAKYLVDQQVSILQVNAKLNELSAFVLEGIRAEFSRFGLEAISFNVESISLPEAEQQRLQEILGKRLEIDQIGQARVGQAYVTMRSFDALDKAATNPGVGGTTLNAALGLGLGAAAGVEAGKRLGEAISQGVNPANPAPATDALSAKLAKLKQLLDNGLITQQDYDAKKAELLKSM